jgi:ligand-binding SRPBCC domain-containing protein
MKIYFFTAKQILPVRINDAWNFFSNPKNLREITPGWLNFKIVGELPDDMYKGMIINYIVNPVLGIPLKWMTEITEINKPFSFTDEQRRGPYKLWRHRHLFREVESGTEMIDEVEYALPLGPAADLINKLIVSGKVKEIFKYRENILKRIFK